MTDTEIMLTEFIKTFKGSLDIRLWFKLIKEELAELKEAIAANDKVEMLKEFSDLLYVMQGFMLMADMMDRDFMQDDELLAIVDLFEDCEKVALSIREVFTQEQREEAFKRVHNSNMSKLGEDGKPIFREDGKVLKGPNYAPANLTDLIKE